METVNNESKRIDEVRDNYENIRMAISGLREILNINYDKDNLYYQAGLDNLIGIKENLLEILKKSYSPHQIDLKLREIELDADLEMNENQII
ncbi:MAG: hypothetical protein P8Y70_01725 [Candidatus Lokiarchaeota archaeon]